MPEYPKTPAEFKELGRVQTSDKVAVVVSECLRDSKLTGWSINKYIKSEEYTGFSKGTFVPEEDIVDFLRLFPQEELEIALESLTSEGGTKGKKK